MKRKVVSWNSSSFFKLKKHAESGEAAQLMQRKGGEKMLNNN